MDGGTTMREQIFSYYMLNGAGTESWECMMAAMTDDNQHVYEYYSYSTKD
jgi:hypothetical protein